MKIGVVGSCYGELDRVYEAVRKLAKQGITIDLLICCGDFMSVRDGKDMEHVAAPAHHKEDLKDFPKYFSGRSEAPVTTVFIGGKNEASNLLREHYYGGWVAPGIYYMGAAGVLRVGCLRIAGISGSFASGDYFRGRHECPPYTEEFKRSAFHAREWDAARLEKLHEPVDVVISYDWPRGIWKHGPYQKIIEQQDLGENLKREMEGNTLGSPAAMELMKKLRPPFWFSASLQVRFPALVPHGDGTFTRFLALERCRGGREFLQVLDIDPRTPSAMRSLPAPKWQRCQPPVPAAVPLCYDAEWMAMQKVNHENISLIWHPAKSRVIAPAKEDLLWIRERLKKICGTQPRMPGGRHPNLTPTKLRKSRGAGRQTFQNFSTLQLRELFEIRGMDFPGHLDKASMIQHLEDFDALHGGDEYHKDADESYPIPTGFIAMPAAQRGQILEILQLPDIWKVQEENRRQLLRTAQIGAVDVSSASYDPFGKAEPPTEDPAAAGETDKDDTAASTEVDPGAVTGRSPSPSTPSEDDFTAPAQRVASKEVPAAPGNPERTSPEPEPEPRKLLTAASEGDAAEPKMLEAMEEADPQEEAPAAEAPAEVELEPGDVDPLDPLDPLEVDPEVNAEEAEHLALEEDLASLEAELAIAEQLLRDPQDPQLQAVADSVASIPVSVTDDLLPESPEAGHGAEEAAQLLAQAVMGLTDLEVEAEDFDNIETEELQDIDGGEVQVDDHLDLKEVSGFAALALAVEEAEREEAEEAVAPLKVPHPPRKRRRF
eukprot:s922_g21.t1